MPVEVCDVRLRSRKNFRFEEKNILFYLVAKIISDYIINFKMLIIWTIYFENSVVFLNHTIL